ncbi:hypothetical protein AKO1_001195 [Acrasis kona]|uniref:Uncharacterized protein n=1 Tax=Acrasis kona TaxID=1008807 RepID=A0AAW2ZE27_9EUKA
MTAATFELSNTLKDLFTEGKLSAVIGLGGSCNTSICCEAFRETLPLGFPKLMVSTMASGDVSSYICEADIVMMPSIVDISGMNNVLKTILNNASNAVVGMAKSYRPILMETKKPTIAISMFGVTTPCVEEAQALLQQYYEVLVFHSTGTGGKSLERLIEQGSLAGVLDVTTTELVDSLLGGILSAGPNRLEAAGKYGIPQVVSLGALDMCNFGPKYTVPQKYKDRHLHAHNSTVTLMRTNIEENERLGKWIAQKLSDAKGPTKLFIPLRGVSAMDIKDGPFFDEQAREALFSNARRAECEVVEIDAHINDKMFATAMAESLHQMIKNKNQD